MPFPSTRDALLAQERIFKVCLCFYVETASALGFSSVCLIADILSASPTQVTLSALREYGARPLTHDILKP